MKHVKLFEQFLSEKYTNYSGKWKVEVWGIPPGAKEWELVDTKKGFKNAEEAQKWARTQPQGKSVAYDIEPEKGWIDPAGTWHPENEDYDPASAYESLNIDEAAKQKISLSQIVSWLKSHGFKIVSSEKNRGHRKWAEGGKWQDLVKDCKAIKGRYDEIDLITFKEKVIFGPGFQINKQGESKVFVHFTPGKKDNFNRKIGYEE